MGSGRLGSAWQTHLTLMQDQESAIDQGLDRLAHILGAVVTAVAFFPGVALVLECLRDDLADGLMGRLSRRLFVLGADACHVQMQGDCLQCLVGPLLPLGLG